MNKRPLVAMLLTLGTAAALVALGETPERSAPALPDVSVPVVPTEEEAMTPLFPGTVVKLTEASSVGTPIPGEPAVDIDRGLPPVATAIADFAAKARLDPSDVQVLRLQRVTWNDGSLGCPQPGMMYTQALVDGYRLELGAPDLQAIYHTDALNRVLRCDREQPGSWSAGETE